jgi:hypothetical protein
VGIDLLQVPFDPLELPHVRAPSSVHVRIARCDSAIKGTAGSTPAHRRAASVHACGSPAARTRRSRTSAAAHAISWLAVGGRDLRALSPGRSAQVLACFPGVSLRSTPATRRPAVWALGQHLNTPPLALLQVIGQALLGSRLYRLIRPRNVRSSSSS